MFLSKFRSSLFKGLWGIGAKPQGCVSLSILNSHQKSTAVTGSANVFYRLNFPLTFSGTILYIKAADAPFSIYSMPSLIKFGLYFFIISVKAVSLSF